MNPLLAKHVQQVIAYGLDLKEKTERGERPPVDQELQSLRGLLNGPSELKNDPEYFGLKGDARMTTGEAPFLGARYALTCWLDEIFVLDSPLGELWDNRILEFDLFRSRDRAEQFWEQWRKAEQRPGTDALEVYYWCAQLGFRGKFRDNPNELRNWIEAAKARIVRAHRDEIKLPVDQGFVTDVPQLVGEERFGTMVRLVAGAILFLVPVLVYLALSAMK